MSPDLVLSRRRAFPSSVSGDGEFTYERSGGHGAELVRLSDVESDGTEVSDGSKIDVAHSLDAGDIEHS